MGQLTNLPVELQHRIYTLAMERDTPFVPTQEDSLYGYNTSKLASVSQQIRRHCLSIFFKDTLFEIRLLEWTDWEFFQDWLRAIGDYWPRHVRLTASCKMKAGLPLTVTFDIEFLHSEPYYIAEMIVAAPWNLDDQQVQHKLECAQNAIAMALKGGVVNLEYSGDVWDDSIIHHLLYHFYLYFLRLDKTSDFDGRIHWLEDDVWSNVGILQPTHLTQVLTRQRLGPRREFFKLDRTATVL